MKPPKITQGEWHRQYESCYERNGVEHSRYSVKDSTNKVIAWHIKPIDAQAIQAVPDMIKALIEMATVWHSDVYHHFYHLYDQDAEKAKDRADNDEYYQMMINALKKAGAKL